MLWSCVHPSLPPLSSKVPQLCPPCLPLESISALRHRAPHSANASSWSAHTCDSFVRVISIITQLPHRTHRWQLRPLSRRSYPTHGLQACFREETARVTLHGGVSTSSASLICKVMRGICSSSILSSRHSKSHIATSAQTFLHEANKLASNHIKSRPEESVSPVPTWTFLGTINPSSNLTAP